MPNRAYTDMEALRRDVQALLASKRVRWTQHADEAHAEISREDQLKIIRDGRKDRPNWKRPDEPSYICCCDHPVHGLCRAAYAILESRGRTRLLVITVFKED